MSNTTTTKRQQYWQTGRGTQAQAEAIKPKPTPKQRLFADALIAILDKTPSMTAVELAERCDVRIEKVIKALMADDRFVSTAPRWTHPIHMKWRLVDE